jgi:predicted phosphodiesterase
MDQHQTLCALKTLALELGRTPTRYEFETRFAGGKYALERHFRTFAALLQAAGMETYRERQNKDKIGNEVFERSIERVIQDYQPRELPKPSLWPKLLVISDIHWPFSHKKVIERFYDRVAEFQPEIVVLNGDAWDMYSHSKFARSHNQFTPREEHSLARSENENFWSSVQRLAPNVKCFQLLGNHDVRPLKRVLEAYPEAEDWVEKGLREAFTFTGVETFYDPRQELFLGEDIAVFHGYRSGLGAHRDFTLMNCINGHTHLGGVSFRQIQGRTLWELNSGLAGDPEAKGLTYTPQRITKWTLGFGEVDHLGPRFIPLR